MSGWPRGVGIGLRLPHYREILKTERRIDWLEIVPENYVGPGGRRRRVLDACRERWPLIPHGVTMSVGGPDDIDEDWLRGLKALADHLDAPYYSDHLCYASLSGIETFDLLPLPYRDEAAEHVAQRVKRVSERLERPVLLENVTYYSVMPGSVLTEGEFVTRAIEGGDCSLLLDINNIYCNAKNHGRDPLDVLLELPLSRARQMHLAGFVPEGPRLIDNHGTPVHEEVWALYREALRRTGPIPVLLEWDTDIPPLDTVLDEADRARAIMDEECPGWDGAAAEESGA